MKILLVNHYAGSPEMGMEFRPYYMARLWKVMGYDVMIVASSYSHLRSKQPVVTNKFEWHEIEGVSYALFKTRPYHGNGLKRILNIFEFVWHLYTRAAKVITDFNPDVIIASSTYPLEIYPLKKLARKNNAKLIFEVHDLWPLSPRLLGGYSKYHPFIYIMQQAENYAYRYSDAVVSLLPCTLEHMQEHGLKKEKWHYVPNGIYLYDDAELEIELPQEHIDLIQRLKKENALLVGYAGSIGVANNIQMLIDSRRLIKNDRIHLIITGNGPEKEKIIQQMSDSDRKFVHFLDAVPKRAVVTLLRKMDMLIITWNKSPLYAYGVSANKLFDYMFSAKPIVQALEAGNDPVMESGCGITVEPENKTRIAEAIETIANMPEEERITMGENGKQFVLKRHTYQVLAKEFAEILHKL